MRENHLSVALPELGIGLIGTGFMGRAHALAFGNANAALELPARTRLVSLADADSVRAEHCAQTWGFDRSHADWQQLIHDPRVQIVAITTPNYLHYPMAMAAIAAGKAVYCEKPLAISLAEADEMRRSAKAAGVVTKVGYNYQHNPMIVPGQRHDRRGRTGRHRQFSG